MKLYELTEQHRELQNLIESDNTDLAEALADTFEALEGEFNDKAVSLISVVNNLTSDTDAIDAEINRLKERKKVIENKQKSLKEYLRMNMEASGISKIECPLFSITLGKGRDIVDIVNAELIPTDYVDMEMVIKPRKNDILKALKAGEDVPGAALIKSKSSLRIK